ncbi:conserved hypothetical protein [Xanthomonas citri pv. fuscans]|nr:conserved hypothetical protein [Xanthomonas citri pv. fuscans]SOO34106.1 hypothetical protein XFF6994_3530013 [Xanthomonas citri pv. fuscans]
MRAAASGEANYMPAEPIWEVFCEKFFTKLPKFALRRSHAGAKPLMALGLLLPSNR